MSATAAAINPNAGSLDKSDQNKIVDRLMKSILDRCVQPSLEENERWNKTNIIISKELESISQKLREMIVEKGRKIIGEISRPRTLTLEEKILIERDVSAATNFLEIIFCCLEALIGKINLSIPDEFRGTLDFATTHASALSFVLSDIDNKLEILREDPNQWRIDETAKPLETLRTETRELLSSFSILHIDYLKKRFSKIKRLIKPYIPDFHEAVQRHCVQSGSKLIKFSMEAWLEYSQVVLRNIIHEINLPENMLRQQLRNEPFLNKILRVYAEVMEHNLKEIFISPVERILSEEGSDKKEDFYEYFSLFYEGKRLINRSILPVYHIFFESFLNERKKILESNDSASIKQAKMDQLHSAFEETLMRDKRKAKDLEQARRTKALATAKEGELKNGEEKALREKKQLLEKENDDARNVLLVAFIKLSNDDKNLLLEILTKGKHPNITDERLVSFFRGDSVAIVNKIPFFTIKETQSGYQVCFNNLPVANFHRQHGKPINEKVFNEIRAQFEKLGITAAVVRDLILDPKLEVGKGVVQHRETEQAVKGTAEVPAEKRTQTQKLTRKQKRKTSKMDPALASSRKSDTIDSLKAATSFGAATVAQAASGSATTAAVATVISDGEQSTDSITLARTVSILADFYKLQADIRQRIPQSKVKGKQNKQDKRDKPEASDKVEVPDVRKAALLFSKEHTAAHASTALKTVALGENGKDPKAADLKDSDPKVTAPKMSESKPADQSTREPKPTSEPKPVGESTSKKRCSRNCIIL